jgi:hypothetical protein
MTEWVVDGNNVMGSRPDGWWRDRATWPTPRSLAVFRNWFDCQFHSMVLDLADEPLIQEEI